MKDYASYIKENLEVDNSFEVGDRVRYVHKDGVPTRLERLDDKCGVVKGRSLAIGNYAVEFDESFDLGHSCEGLCIDGKGRWIRPDLLELEEPLEKLKIKWYYKGKLEEKIDSSYKEDDVDIIGEEEELKNVRWYYKGKLE